MSSESGPHQLQDEAYILHTRTFKNTSLIIEVFSKDHGRFDLVAKGARRKDSAFQGILQPFTPLFLVWGGRSELKTLYKAEVLKPATDRSRVELKREFIYAGFYVNELLMYLLHKHEAHPDLFRRYKTCLESLANLEDLEITLRYFELDLLDELGYGASLDHLASNGEPVQSDQMYYYHIESGVLPIEIDEVAMFKISGDTLLALARRNLTGDQHRQEAKQLLRRILEVHLEGRPIKTRELFVSRKCSV